MKFIKIIALLLMGAVNVSGQDERYVRMIYFGAPKGAPKTATIIQAKRGGDDVKLLTKNFSSSIKLEKKSEIFVIAPEGTVRDDEGQWLKYPRVKIPNNWKNVIIFISEDKENTLFPLKGVAVDASESTFGKGDMMFVNFSNYDVSGTAGNKKVNLKANSREVTKNLLPKAGNCYLQLDMVNPEDKKKSSLVRKSWPYSLRSRLVFFVVPRVDKHPIYHATVLKSFK